MYPTDVVCKLRLRENVSHNFVVANGEHWESVSTGGKTNVLSKLR